MSLSHELRARTAPTWEAAVGHRFVDELWRGAVASPVLRAYFVQDHQFLDSFLALLGAAVASADRPEPRIVLARQLGLIAGPENDFFSRVLHALDVAPTDRAAPRLTKVTRDFLELIDSTRASVDYPTCLAVLLVAEWVYLDWADRPGAPAPDYWVAREWIELHRGRAFAEWVGFLRAEFDRVTAQIDAAARERLAVVFDRAVALELQFFDAAYQIEDEP